MLTVDDVVRKIEGMMEIYDGQPCISVDRAGEDKGYIVGYSTSESGRGLNLEKIS